jgi:hypothetical protein
LTEWAYSADGETIRRFMSSEAFVRGLRGPVGSGKSVAACAEIFRRACAQAPSKGVRRSRWAVIRNTQPELKTTTIKTWLDWFPEEEFGKFRWSSPFTHHIRKPGLDLEMIFLALDTPEDVKKLLSLELTGVWINEARQVPKAVLDAATGRVGRFPSQREGGCTWSGIIMDTNSPDEDHWWAIMSGDVPPPDWMSEEERRHLVRPEGWTFFTQPAALLKVKDLKGDITEYVANPKRENQKGVKDSYYLKQLAGKTSNYINVYLCNEYGSLSDGKAVHPEFDRTFHVAQHPLDVAENTVIHVGIDFGLSPAALFGQNVLGRWHVLRELVTFDTDIVAFVRLLKKVMAEIAVSGSVFQLWGDPAGDIRSQTDKNTPFLVFRNAGVAIRPAPSNDVALRLSAVNEPLARRVNKGPGLLIDPRCSNYIRGLEGGYQYRRIQGTAERYEETPLKNRFSHLQDGGQYMFLGGGEGRQILRGQSEMKVVHAQKSWDVFDRRPKKIGQVRLKGW